MTATNVIIDNWIDYSTQLNNLSTIATYLSSLPALLTSIQRIETLLSRISTATEIISTSTVRLANTSTMTFNYNQTKDDIVNYFEGGEYNLVPEVESAGSWSGKTSVITLVTSTRNVSIIPGYRVKGDNIDIDTVVSSINVTTRTLNISKQTLGSSKGNNILSFYAS